MAVTLGEHGPRRPLSAPTRPLCGVAADTVLPLLTGSVPVPLRVAAVLRQAVHLADASGAVVLCLATPDAVALPYGITVVGGPLPRLAPGDAVLAGNHEVRIAR